MQTSRRTGWGRRPSPWRGNRGVALMLTLLALAMAFILALGFLAAQSTTTGMGQNIDHQAVANCIAQTGLNYALGHIVTDSTWRTDNSNGVWINAQSLYGGTLTLKGEDGIYNPTTNSVVGTGNLNSSPTDTVTITSSGTYQGVTQTLHLQINTTATTTGSGAALPGGACANGSITLSGSGMIDAFNSANGAYGGSNVITNKAVVTTNSTAANTVTMSGGALIKGSVDVGVGGNTATAINAPTWGTFITGSKGTLSTAVTMTAPTAPTNTGSSLGALNVASVTHQTISSNCHYSSLTVNNSGILYISGNVTMLIDGDVNIEGAGQFIIDSGSSLTLAVGGNFTVTNSGQVNMTTNSPSALQISMLTSGKNMTLSGAGDMYATVDMPQGQLYATGSGAFYGQAICNTLVADGSGAFHLDTNPLTTSPGGGGGGSTTYSYTSSRLDQP